MSDNELRELDARFAREVLGTIHDTCQCDGYPLEDWDGWRCDSCAATGSWGITAHDWEPLFYTRDLSAAWGGVDKVGGFFMLRNMPTRILDDGTRLEPYFTASFKMDMTWEGKDAPHPAEAIVRACLAAVEGQPK
jgi:hypothetical protein